MKVKIRFESQLSACDPAQRNIVIVGQVPHLSLIPWDVVSVKLNPRVEKRVSIYSSILLTSTVFFFFFLARNLARKR